MLLLLKAETLVNVMTYFQVFCVTCK